MSPSSASGRFLHQVLVSERLGGGELVAIELASRALARRIPVAAWVPAPGDAQRELDRRGVPSRLYSLPRLTEGGASQIVELASVAVRLAAQGAGVLHVHGPWAYGLLSPILRPLGLKSVVHFHLDPSDDTVRWCLQRPPDAVIGCSQSIADRVTAVARAHFLSVPVHAVPNAVDLARFAPDDRAGARLRVGARPGCLILLMVANLAEHKGQRTAIRCLADLRARGIDAECWLAGEDRDAAGFAAVLQEEASRLGVAGYVRLLGQRGDAEMLLRAADVFLLPSTHEGLPLSILEAQATGVPVLATPLPGIREIVAHQRTGFLLEAGDAAGYAATIVRLATEPRLAAEVIGAARAQVLARHSWDHYASRVFEVYRTLGIPVPAETPAGRVMESTAR